MTGSGTLLDPYVIWDVTDLQNIELDLTAYYELGQDIDASATIGWNAGEGFRTLGGWTATIFTGHLDGKGFVISDLFFSVIGLPRYAGLFYEISAGSVVQNLGLEDVNISASNMCGAFGRRNSGIIRRCYSTGVMISEAPDCGGLIQGNFAGGVIEKSYSIVDITCGVGGLGGGLVGTNDGNIDDSYARGDIDGLPFGTAGGLVGNNGAPITNCYSTGLVTAANPGGLVSAGLPAFVTNSFWDTETSGQAASVGGGTGKTTAEMKDSATFIGAGWDFATIWTICSGVNNDYPCLLGVTPSCVLAPVVIPTVTTNPATAISHLSAILNGTLDGGGGEVCECGFEWGLDTGYGMSTPTDSKVTSESFSQAIGGLFPGTTYHFRAFATNSVGTGFGADRSFITTPSFNRAHALSREEM